MDVGALPFVELAREAIRHYATTSQILRPGAAPDDPPPTGVFVSLHQPPRSGEDQGPLRGCIGSTVPSERTLRDEIARAAVAAAYSDPRFKPLSVEEVDGLDITVYLLDDPEPVDDLSDLDPERYGVVVRKPGGRTGLLLPSIPGITTPEQQVAVARQKGRYSSDEEVQVFRFGAEIVR